MREEGRVEVETDLQLLREFDPALEVLGLELVAIHLLAVLEDRIARVEVQAVLAGDELEREFEILHQLLGRTRFARIVAGGLDAARESAGILETGHVITLPAVHRNRYLLQLPDGLLGIHAERSILLLRFLITHLSFLLCVGGGVSHLRR